jgi:hypothetical protein
MSEETNGGVTHLGNYAAVLRILLRLKPDRRQIRLGGHRRRWRHPAFAPTAAVYGCAQLRGGMVLALASQR